MDKRLNRRTTERIEGLVDENALMHYKLSIKHMTQTMLDEGFDYEEIKDYLLDSLELNLYKAMDWISNEDDGILHRDDEANYNNDFYEDDISGGMRNCGDVDEDIDPAGGYGLQSHV